MERFRQAGVALVAHLVAEFVEGPIAGVAVKAVLVEVLCLVVVLHRVGVLEGALTDRTDVASFDCNRQGIIHVSTLPEKDRFGPRNSLFWWYSRTPLIRLPSESHWCGRIRGMVAHGGFVYEHKPMSVTRNVVV